MAQSNPVKQKWQHSFSKPQAIFTFHLKFYSYSKALWPHAHRRYWTYLCCYAWDCKQWVPWYVLQYLHVVFAACKHKLFLKRHSLRKLPVFVSPLVKPSPDRSLSLTLKEERQGQEDDVWGARKLKKQVAHFQIFFGTSYSSGLNSLDKSDLNWQMDLQISRLGTDRAITWSPFL